MSKIIIAPETIICAEGNLSDQPDLRILHFNDVYHVEPSNHDPVGGIARFQSMCNHYRSNPVFQSQPELIALFSGDGFNPSLESSVTKGSHMIPILNNIPTAAACVGNHDLDLGVHQFEHLASQCKFPWLLANVLDPALGDDVPIGHAEKTVIITASNGIKVGLIGLAEKEWLEAVNALPPNLIYIDSPTAANQLVPDLRARGADIVIAICHQREFHDNRLAQETPDGLIDIILGGHDHHYRYSKIKDTHVLCSGSDFKQLSYIEARLRKDPKHEDSFHVKKWDFSIIRRDVVRTVPEDSATLDLMEHLFASLKAKLEKPVGYTAVPLDSRFTTVRTRESNLGNFVSDLMRYYYDADCAIMSGGTIRGDVVYPPGILRMKDIMDCFPFEDPTVVVEIKGKAIWQALENRVSHYPALEGRFPQVSNIHFVFDPTRPPFHRVISVRIGGREIDPEMDYSVATRDYMVNGGDGYMSLRLTTNGGQAIPLVKEENGVLISMLLRQHFLSSTTLFRWKNLDAPLDQHWQNVHRSFHDSSSINTRPHVQDILALNNITDKKSKVEVPGLIGKCLRQDTFRPSVTCPSSALLSHEKNVSSAENPLFPHEQPSVPISEFRFVTSTTNTRQEISLSDSESDQSDETTPRASIEVSKDQRQLKAARKAARKWWRLAGLDNQKGHAMGFEKGEELREVAWTRGIYPRVEGRIRVMSRV